MQKPERVSLMDAIQQWCDPKLLAALKSESRCYPKNVHSRTQWPIIVPDHQLPVSDGTSWMMPEIPPPLAMAWRAVEEDLRDRIVRKQLYLEGVKTHPKRETCHSPIPAVWAADMNFAWASNALRVGGNRWIDIRVSTTPFPGTEPIEVAISCLSTPAAPTAQAMPVSMSRRGRGRTSHRPLVLEAIRDKWDTVCVNGVQASTWSAMAGWLHQHLIHKYPDKHKSKGLPAKETIRGLLQELYRAVQRERSVG